MIRNVVVRREIVEMRIDRCHIRAECDADIGSTCGLSGAGKDNDERCSQSQHEYLRLNLVRKHTAETDGAGLARHAPTALTRARADAYARSLCAFQPRAFQWCRIRPC